MALIITNLRQNLILSGHRGYMFPALEARLLLSFMTLWFYSHSRISMIRPRHNFWLTVRAFQDLSKIASDFAEKISIMYWIVLLKSRMMTITIRRACL